MRDMGSNAHIYLREIIFLCEDSYYCPLLLKCSGDSMAYHIKITFVIQ